MKCIKIALIGVVLALGVAVQSQASTYNVQVSMGAGVHVVHTGWEEFGGDHNDRYTFMYESTQYETLDALKAAKPFLKGLI